MTKQRKLKEDDYVIYAKTQDIEVSDKSIHIQLMTKNDAIKLAQGLLESVTNDFVPWLVVFTERQSISIYTSTKREDET